MTKEWVHSYPRCVATVESGLRVWIGIVREQFGNDTSSQKTSASSIRAADEPTPRKDSPAWQIYEESYIA